MIDITANNLRKMMEELSKRHPKNDVFTPVNYLLSDDEKKELGIRVKKSNK